jgi:hypothetical protein
LTHGLMTIEFNFQKKWKKREKNKFKIHIYDIFWHHLNQQFKLFFCGQERVPSKSGRSTYLDGWCNA